MSNEIRFDGQVAIVTGGAGGMGRAHSLLLARRGAAVVVNDIGTSVDGQGSDSAPAHDVAAEIVQGGGRAISVTDDCGTPEGGQAVVERAIEAFGRVDVLVHNAGIVHAGSFASTPMDEVQKVLNVHLMAAWYVGQPAWMDMASRGYGRIVLKASGAIFGHPMVGPYTAAKFGLIGLARTLAKEATLEGVDIKTNVVCPIAGTRMAREAQKARWGDMLHSSEVSAVVAYLLSKKCRVNGEILHGGGTHFARIFIGQADGWALGQKGLTPEMVMEHLDEGMDLDGFIVPADTNSSLDFLYHRATGRSDTFQSAQIAPNEVSEKKGLPVFK